MAEADPFRAEPGSTTASTIASPAAIAAADHVQRTRARRWRTILMLAGPALLIGGALWYWFGRPGEVDTDNAYVKQDIVSMAAELTGVVTSVRVHENQHVHAGDILFTINPGNFEANVDSADAQIASAQAKITALQADVSANTVDIASARDDLALAQANYARGKALMDRGFNTRASMDEAEHAVAAARDKVASLEATVTKSRALLATGSQVPGQNPAVAAARAARARAALDLARTVIRAPADGVATQLTRLQVGQMAFAGVPMASLVKDQGTCVEANFKETDLGQIRPGQRAEVTIDAYPGLVLKGHVDSIGAGTGSEFSLLPAQNATGNWVKVVQRVPVRIAIDGQGNGKPDRPLIAGLSSNVTIYTGKR
jgi:membrane fusion protein (multidrug efflux system)